MCVDCQQSSFKTFYLTCRVCELIDDDKEAKWVSYCETCKAYICESCYKKGFKRIKAAIKNFIIS